MTDRDLPRLPAAAEALLRRGPVLGPEPDWEARVDAIVAAIPGEGPVDPAWFAAPALPPEPGEPGSSLKELALRHVAAEEERQAAERAAAVRPLLGAASAGAPREAAAPDAQRPGAEAGPPADRPAAPPADRPAAPAPPAGDELAARRRQRSAALAGLGVLAAAAALFLLVSPARNAAPPELAAGPPRPLAVAAAPRPVTPTVGAAPEVGGAAPRAAGAGGAPPAGVALGGRPLVRPAPSPLAVLPAPGASAPAQPPEEPPLLPGLRPADGSEPRPLQPSAGVVHAALERAMPAARACLVMQEGPVQASVVFGSEGTVRSVGVEGPAGATAEGECVRQALSRARVAPFEKAEYRTTVTVRP